MPSLRVFFYTGSFTHTMYREQVRAMPDSVEVSGSSAELFSSGIKEDLTFRRAGRFGRSLRQMGMRALIHGRVPNVRFVRAGDADLIHSAQYLILNRRPWVVDFEDASVFTWYDPGHLRSAATRRRVARLLRSEHCRAILPWTHAARESLEHALDCSAFAHKIRVVYPAIAPRTGNSTRASRAGEMNLLFIGSAFYEKGGVDAIEGVAGARRSGCEIRLRVVSRVPDEVRERYRDQPWMSFHTRVEPAALASFYSSADALIAPFHTDTFGFVLLEAFAYGLPCIATDEFAAAEIVADGVTGLLVPNYASRFGPDRLPAYALHSDASERFRARLMTPPGEYVGSLARAIERLAADPGLRRRMGERALEEVTAGRFSYASRKAALSDVYTRASQGSAS